MPRKLWSRKIAWCSSRPERNWTHYKNAMGKLYSQCTYASCVINKGAFQLSWWQFQVMMRAVVFTEIQYSLPFVFVSPSQFPIVPCRLLITVPSVQVVWDFSLYTQPYFSFISYFQVVISSTELWDEFSQLERCGKKAYLDCASDIKNNAIIDISKQPRGRLWRDTK